MPPANDLRYATAVLSNAALDATVAARLETYERHDGRIHSGHLSDGGTLTAFLQLQGDGDDAAEIGSAIERHPRPVTYEFDVGDDIRLYMNFEPVEWTRDLHEAFRRHDVVVDWPMEPTADAGLRFTVVGEEPVIKDALSALEADWHLTVERVGSYQFGHRSIESDLTARQREILRRAVEAGYYDLPRRATQADLAAAFDVSTGTISEHLRKIEATVFSSVVE